MFNPAKFTAAPRRTIAICNSQHPVCEHIDSLLLTRVKSKEEMYADLYYVVITGNQYVMTYREESYGTDTIQLHKLSFEEFKAKVVAKEPLKSDYELVNCDSTNKWIGNDILQYLTDEEIVK